MLNFELYQYNILLTKLKIIEKLSIKKTFYIFIYYITILMLVTLYNNVFYLLYINKNIFIKKIIYS